MDTWLLVWLSFGQAAIAWPDRDPVVLRVRAYADSRVDKATVRGAEDVARRLLAAGGLKTEWRSCDTAESCPAVPGVRDAVVRLSVPAIPYAASAAATPPLATALGQAPSRCRCRASPPSHRACRTSATSVATRF